jgi:hypothetical protein
VPPSVRGDEFITQAPLTIDPGCHLKLSDFGSLCRPTGRLNIEGSQ